MKLNQLADRAIFSRDYTLVTEKGNAQFLASTLSGKETSFERFQGFQIALEFLQYLDSLEISYSWCMKHPKPNSCIDSTQFYCRFHDYIGGPEDYIVCKNLFLQTRKEPKKKFLVVTAPEKRIDLKLFQQQLDSKKLEFAKDMEMQQVFHTYPGNLSVFHMIYDMNDQVELLLDRDLFKEEDSRLLAFHPLYNELSLFMKAKDTLRFLQVIDHSYRLIAVPQREGELVEPKQYQKGSLPPKL